MLKKFLLTTIAILTITTSVIADTGKDTQIVLSVPTQTMATNPDANSIIYKDANSLDIVKAPKSYYNSYVKITGKFDKFSTLGLDYSAVKKDSKDFISFLIKRDDVKDYNIPLSELKLIVKRDYAEKELINLEPGDEIKILGKVFSIALGDPWVEVDKVEYSKKDKDKDKTEDKK